MAFYLCLMQYDMKMNRELGRIESKLGYDGVSQCQHLGPFVVIDEENSKLYMNSSSGNGVVYGFDGKEITNYRGCAEIDKANDIVINEFDIQVKKKV